MGYHLGGLGGCVALLAQRQAAYPAVDRVGDGLYAGPMDIHVTYNDEADAAYISLVPIGPGEVATTEAGVDEKLNINLDYNAEGRLIGIEVLGASGTLPSAVLDAAERHKN